MLDRIKLRHLLNKAQEMLAVAARLTLARAILHNPGIKLDQPTQTFISLTQGLSLVVEAKSLIRQRGDRVAHPTNITRVLFDGPISRNPYASETPGLQALVDFVCSRE
jgi:hypothetical protein